MDSNNVIEGNTVWYVKLDNLFNNVEDDFVCGSPQGKEQNGLRPVFVVTTTDYNQSSGTPIVLCCSTIEKKSSNKYSFPIFWEGQEKETYVNISQIRTLDSSRFIKYSGKVCDEYTVTNIYNKFMLFMFKTPYNVKNIINFGKVPKEIDGFKVVVRNKKNIISN